MLTVYQHDLEEVVKSLEKGGITNVVTSVTTCNCDVSIGFNCMADQQDAITILEDTNVRFTIEKE